MEEDLSVLSRKASPPDASFIYGEHEDQFADVRYGTQGYEQPLVVFVHGGFWKPEYDRHHAEALSSALAQSGWTTLTLEYRRVPGQPEWTVDDIASAIRVLPSQIPQHNGKLILIGHSAGGHLVLWAASQFPHVSGVLSLAPAADLALAHQLNLGDNAVMRFLGVAPTAKVELDPMHLPAPSMRVHILQGQADEIVPPSVPQSYVGKFPDVVYDELSDCGHFSLIDPESAAWIQVIKHLHDLSIN